MTLGEKIAQMRKAGGISQEQLAEQLGVSRQSVSKWEVGDALPDLSKIILLSELFAVSTDELLKDAPPAADADPAVPPHALADLARWNLVHREIVTGFRTAVAGLVLFVLEFLFLPIFGMIQKQHVAGQGFYSDFIRYAGMQPMPIIFGITALVTLAGAAPLVKGFLDRHRLDGC